MHAQDSYVIGVDLGGTNVRVCAFRNGQPEFIELIKESSDIGDEPSKVMAHIDRLICSIMSKLDITFAQVDHIGIAIPDAVSPLDGVIYFPSTMHEWRGVNVRKYFLDRYQVPVYVENDANMAALGEYHFGSGKGARNMVYLTISTGIGAGIIIDGKLYQGSNGFAGELGQMVLDSSALACPNCGKPGCVEILASGTALQQLAKTSTNPVLRDNKAPEIIQKVRDGDSDATEMLKQVSHRIAQLVLNTLFAIDPDVVVIGGGLSAAYDLIYPEIDSYLSSQLPAALRQKYRIVQNNLGGDVGLLGALGVASRRHDHTLKVAIFDHDGVIALTEDAHEQAFAVVIKKNFGKDLTSGEYNFCFQGKTDMDGFLSYLEHIGAESEDASRLVRESSEEFLRTYAERVKPNKEIVQLMKDLHEAGIPIAVATSSNRRELETSLHAFNLGDCVSVSVTADDIIHGKPSPEIYIIAATRMNVLSDECLVIEDTPVGIAAAKDAGATCVAITTTHAAPQLARANKVLSTLGVAEALELMRRK